MNTTPAATRLTQSVMLAAALAAMFMAGFAQAEPADTTHVVTLPRVTVIGQRVAAGQPVKSPQVMVTGRRLENRRDTRFARRDDAVKPAVVWVAQR